MNAALPTHRHAILLELYRDAARVHATFDNELAQLTSQLASLDEGTVVDAIYCLKQTVALVDDTRKSINRAVAVLEKIGCAMTVKKAENTLSGCWASAYAQVTEQPSVPHPDREPAAYEALMHSLGVPEEIVKAKTLHPRFDAIGALMAELAAQGKPVPEAMRSAQMIPKHTVVARSKHAGGMDAIHERAGTRSY